MSRLSQLWLAASASFCVVYVYLPEPKVNGVGFMLNKEEWIALAVFLECAGVVILICCLGLSLAWCISEARARLLKQPPPQRIWSIIGRIWDNLDPFVSRCRSMSRFCKEFSVNLLVWAHFQLAFALLRHDIFPASSVRIVDHSNFILVFIAAGRCFQAACEDLESNLIRWLNPKYVSLLKKLWLLLNWMAIGFRCVDFVPSYLSWPMDCIAVTHTLRAISHLINFVFGLRMQEELVALTHPWVRRFEPELYNPRTVSPRNNMIERLGFEGVNFVHFGSPTLHFLCFFVPFLSGILPQIAVFIWPVDKHILPSFLNLATFSAGVPVLSTAAISILSSNRHSDLVKQILIWFVFLIMNFHFMIATIPVTHLAQFALKDRSSYGWSNIKRTVAILEVLDLLAPHLWKVLLAVVHPGANFLCNVLFPPGRREWVIMGSLKGISVSAIPDTGSDLNIVSDHFIKCHGIKLDSEYQRPIQLPYRKTISIGTVSLPFSFEGEKSTFSIVFTVMPNCVHDVILSNSFLRTTETLTRFPSRLKSNFVPSLHMPRLRLLGTPKQRILGSINGLPAVALPDTGSDVMLMSKQYAVERGLTLWVSTDNADRTCLQYADGSLASTYGIAFDVEWRFCKEDSTSRPCNFHIMDGLPYDVILSNDFLFESKAFSQFKDFFFEQRDGLDLNRTFNELSLIKIVKPQNKAIIRIHGFYRRFLQVVKGNAPSTTNQKDSKSAIQEREGHLRRELQRQDAMEELIRELSPEHQEAAWAAEWRCREQWTKTHSPEG